MAGEGGGTGVPFNPNVFTEDFWEQWPTADDRRAPDYARQDWVRKVVPWFTREGWRDKAQRALLIGDAFRVWQNLKMADPGSKVARHFAKTAAGRELLRTTSAATQTSSPPTIPSSGPTGIPNLGAMTTQEKLALLLRIALEQYSSYREQRAAKAAARAQAKALRSSSMPFPSLGGSFSFSPTLGGGLGGLGSSLGGGGWLDALPSIVGAASPLISRLFEQEATDAPDMLERLGMATGLEGAVEREATFWLPTRTGVTANREIVARNPVTGRMAVWRHMGRPVLYSGDLATCKRVGKIAGRVGRYGRRSLPRARRGRR